MGACCTWVNPRVTANFISEISTGILKLTNYKDLVTTLTENYSTVEKDIVFEKIRDNILYRNSIYIGDIDQVIDFSNSTPGSGAGNDNLRKINCYDLLIFSFPITKHEDEVIDFFNLTVNYEKKPFEKANKSLDRNTIKKVLKKMIFYHTEFMLNFLDLKYIENLDQYKKKFVSDNIISYVENLLKEFDEVMKKKTFSKLLSNKSFFFSLEDLRLCLLNTKSALNNKSLIVDLEQYIDRYLS